MAYTAVLDDGTEIEFDRRPTPQDVDFASKKIQSDRARSEQEKAIATPEPDTVMEKIAGFTGGKKIAQGLGQALANPEISKGIEDTQALQFDTQTRLINTIKAKEARGEDATRLKQALEILDEDIKSYAGSSETLMNQDGLTGKEVLGDALQLGTTIATAGTLPKPGMQSGKLVKPLLTKPTVVEGVLGGTASSGLIKGGAMGALKGAGKAGALGATEGAIQGAAQGLQNDEGDGIGDDVLEGTIFGGAFGTVLGGLAGGVVGGLKGKKLSDAVIKAQEDSGLRPTLSKTVTDKAKTNPNFSGMVKEAGKQGYTEKEINFLSTVSDADKPVLQKMFNLTASAQSNPRQVERASDLLGDNATGIVRQVQTQNREAGKAVDSTAKALKGQFVDAMPVRERALTLLTDLGVTAGKNGKPNWSTSIFSKTPEIQTKLMKTLADLPAGQMDAYDLHNFKKSIDEVVEYGVGGEGLKGKSASLLKAIRKQADDILDSNFEDYNLANTEFRETREFIDKVKLVVGKNVDFSTKQGGQAFGQAFRSAFSNNKSRPRTLALIEELQAVAKQRKLKGAEQNLLDQAIYVNMLEDQFGSQASTGLSSEVRKGVEQAKKLRGSTVFETAVNVGVDAYEKSRNINPEAKKELLNKFLK